IAVTDHDTLEGALRATERAAKTGGVEVVIGEEVSSRDGHILGLFLEGRVRPGMSAAATLHAIHDQGGLAIAPPPFWRTQRPARLAQWIERLTSDQEVASSSLAAGTSATTRASARRGGRAAPRCD